MALVHASSPKLIDRSLLQKMVEVETAYTKIHTKGATPAPSELLWGPPVDQINVVENGAHYVVRPTGGLFLDTREVRTWLRKNAEGRTVLNLFAYSCSFGLVAALGGARRVVNLDLSKAYLDWGKTNYQLNGLKPEDQDFIYGDAFDWLNRFHKRDSRFDLVIVDPPSFSSTPFSVTRDYPRLAAAAARIVAPAGMLLAATNHAGTSDERFETWLRAGLNAADRHGRHVQRWHEPAADFPVAVGRRPYLKVRALVLD